MVAYVLVEKKIYCRKDFACKFNLFNCSEIYFREIKSILIGEKFNLKRVDKINITWGVERKYFKYKQWEIGGIIFENFKYNTHILG